MCCDEQGMRDQARTDPDLLEQLVVQSLARRDVVRALCVRHAPFVGRLGVVGRDAHRERELLRGVCREEHLAQHGMAWHGMA